MGFDFDGMFKGLDKQKKAREAAVEGEITAMEHGIISDFVKPENLVSFKKPDQEAMQIHIKTPDGYAIKALLTVSSHPNSNLQRYFGKYKAYPKIGGKYPLEFKGGFWRQAEL